MSYLSQLPGIDSNDILIMGDFNWNIKEEGTSGSRAVVNIMDLYGLEQHITVPTNVTLYISDRSHEVEY